MKPSSSLWFFATFCFAHSLGCVAGAAEPIVTVNSPADGASLTSPVNYIASATSPDCPSGIVSMRIYSAPFVSAFTGHGSSFNTVLARYDDHLSFYWLEQIFRERHGVEILRQQMVQWVEQIAFWLEPGGYLQIDETPVKVLDPEVRGKAAQGYLWFYSVLGQDVILEFSRSRGQEVPGRRLQGFQGTIQTDAYEVYSALERRHSALLRRIGCLTHARRRFYQALQESFPEALWFIRQIRELYRIEDQVRSLAPENRYQIRQEQAPTLWKALKQRAQELQPKLLPKARWGRQSTTSPGTTRLCSDISRTVTSRSITI